MLQLTMIILRLLYQVIDCFFLPGQFSNQGEGARASRALKMAPAYFRVPITKVETDNIFGSLLGTPYFGQLPNVTYNRPTSVRPDLHWANKSVSRTYIGLTSL